MWETASAWWPFAVDTTVKMKFAKSVLSLALACSTLTVATILSADSEQPPCAYPIGQSGGANVKVAGRLFDIDGKVEYFAGKTTVECHEVSLNLLRIECMVACSPQFELRRWHRSQRSSSGMSIWCQLLFQMWLQFTYSHPHRQATKSSASGLLARSTKSQPPAQPTQIKSFFKSSTAPAPTSTTGPTVSTVSTTSSQQLRNTALSSFSPLPTTGAIMAVLQPTLQPSAPMPRHFSPIPRPRTPTNHMWKRLSRDINPALRFSLGSCAMSRGVMGATVLCSRHGRRKRANMSNRSIRTIWLPLVMRGGWRLLMGMEMAVTRIVVLRELILWRIWGSRRWIMVFSICIPTGMLFHHSLLVTVLHNFGASDRDVLSGETKMRFRLWRHFLKDMLTKYFSWGYNYTWGSTWIEQHDAIGAKAGKPVILEEYGTPFPNNHTPTEGPWYVLPPFRSSYPQSISTRLPHSLPSSLPPLSYHWYRRGQILTTK